MILQIHDKECVHNRKDNDEKEHDEESSEDNEDVFKHIDSILLVVS